MLFEVIGWIGSTFLIACGIPLAYESIKTGHADTFKTSMGKLFLWMWFWGELLTLVYVLSFFVVKWPLIVMGLLNTVLIAIILKYLYFPRINK